MGKKRTTTEAVYTQVMPVVDVADIAQIRQLMHKCGVARSVTYNKLGSLKGWGQDWKKADPTIRAIIHPLQLKMPSKLFEWSVNDCFKAIMAQQDAAKTWIIREIYRKYSDEDEREKILKLFFNDPRSTPWLHRVFRKQYIRGHTYIKNQIVYQKAGYKAKRINRQLIEIHVAGLIQGKRIKLVVKSNRKPLGQIRLIETARGLEIHTPFTRTIPKKPKTKASLGLDKGYTEAFYTNYGDKIGIGLGDLMTGKTERIVRTNRNRYRLHQHQKKLLNRDPVKAALILKNNLGYKVKKKKLQAAKNQIKNLIRRDLRRVIKAPTNIFVEDLSIPIRGKKLSKRINRKLNQWMKGELQNSVERIADDTGSIVTAINAAYTSQVDSLTGTLLGVRNGDCFTRYTGDVLQADKNAATNILHRGTDAEITRFMKSDKVRAVLLERTIRFLVKIGVSVDYALKAGWLLPKFKTEILFLELEISDRGAQKA